MTVATLASPKTTIAYGSFALDETHGILITTPAETLAAPTDGSFYVEFRCRLPNPTFVEATDDATFYGYVLALEAALNIPRQRLLVQTNGVTVKDLNFGSGMTALLITPELRCLEESQHDFKYGLRIRCGFPGNVPGNVCRRDSTTMVVESLQERRICSITATWTASNGVSAYDQFRAAATSFYPAYLPATLTDQHGHSGIWVQQSEDPHFNDEQVGGPGGSLVTVTRVYWEVFSGRRASRTKTITTIGDRRRCVIAALFVSSSGNNALQNFTDNGGAFFDAQLPSNISSGSWVLIASDPEYLDSIDVLQVTNTYEEAVDGLCQYEAVVTSDAAGLRTLVVSGVYYSTGSSARTNYDTNAQNFVTGLLGVEGITNFEAISIPKVVRYDQNLERLFFTWTIRELAIEQSGSGFDDENVTMEWIDLDVEKPFDAQSITSGNPVTRLKVVNATFVATISVDKSVDPVGLWADGLRDYVVTLCGSKLGADVTSVEVTYEKVGAGLHKNQLVGRLTLLVGGGSVLWCRIVQILTQVPGRDFAPRGDGTQFSYYPYRAPAEKLLHREIELEYVIGDDPPELFAGDDENEVSGFGLIDTGIAAQDSVDDQNSSDTIEVGGNWFIDRRAPAPLSTMSAPTTRGDMDGFSTCVVKQIENWRYIEALEPGTSLE